MNKINKDIMKQINHENLARLKQLNEYLGRDI